jgi:nucleotide-binding universal stress UspA family protein
MTLAVKTILAATDFSRPAFAAVRRAALIARNHDAKLELLHVIPDSFSSSAWNEVHAALGPVEMDLRRFIQDSFDALVLQIGTETGVRANPFVCEGKPFAEIAARSEAIDADLVVVGAHGETFLTPLLGTTAHRVLRLSHRPVLLVKQTPSVGSGAASAYRHMVIATDFSADSACAAHAARRLFPETIATFLHVYQVPFEAKLTHTVSEQALERYRLIAADRAQNELAAFADSNLRDALRIVRHGAPGLRIREYATETGADLIVTGSEEIPRLQSALLGSVSLDLITEAKCDVLLARVALSTT